MTNPPNGYQPGPGQFDQYGALPQGPQSGAPQYGAPQYGAPPATQPQRPGGRKKWILLTSVLAVIALGIGTFFIVRALTSTPGGADSPTQAIEQFVTSAASLDTAALASVTNPNEIPKFDDVSAAVEERLKKEGVIDKKADDNAKLDWVDLKVEGLQLSTNQVNDEVAFVTVESGTVHWNIDTAKAPQELGELPPDAKSGKFNLAELLADGPNGPVEIGTVKIDGDWYFSPVTTILEQVRIQLELPEPDWSTKPKVGAPVERSTDLVKELVTRINDADLMGLVGLISQKEFPTLAYYVEAAKDKINLSEQLDGVVLTYESGELASENIGDGRMLVSIKQLAIKSSKGDGVELDGWCVGGDDENCQGLAELTGTDAPFYVAVEEDGGYRISVMGTLTKFIENFAKDGKLDQLLGPIGSTQD